MPQISCLKFTILLGASVALTAAVASTPAPAAECSEVRLDKAGGSMARIPVLHQDGTETCYAYAAAQLADAFRHRTVRELAAKGEATPELLELHLKHITSPLVAAVNTAYAAGQDTVNQGHVTKALKSIFQNGSCSHRRIGDRFGAYDSKGFLAELKDYFDGMRARAPGTPIDAPPAPLDCCLESRDPGAPLSRRNLEKFLRATNFVGFLKDAFEAACRRDTLTVPGAEPQAFYGHQQPNVALRQQRFQGTLYKFSKPTDLPIAINYCADILYSRDKTGVGTNGMAVGCATHHSAAIVGRRPGPGGTCQFLVRNSYGDSNNGYAWPAERGQVWIDEAALLRNLTGTVVLE